MFLCTYFSFVFTSLDPDPKTYANPKHWIPNYCLLGMWIRIHLLQMRIQMFFSMRIRIQLNTTAIWLIFWTFSCNLCNFLFYPLISDLNTDTTKLLKSWSANLQNFYVFSKFNHEEVFLNSNQQGKQNLDPAKWYLQIRMHVDLQHCG